MGTVAVIDTCTICNFFNINKFFLFERLNYYLFVTIYVELEIRNHNQSTNDKYDSLIKSGKIKNVPLTIEDLIEMASIPESKKYSDTELSCIVKARQINSCTLTDDKKAIKFITKYLDNCIIKGTKEVLIEAYLYGELSDQDLNHIQEELEKNRFMMKGSLLYEAAEKKLKLSSV